MVNKLFIIFLMSVSMFYAQTNVELIGQLNPYPGLDYSDIWGYVAPDGTEYALMGVAGGTVIIDLSDPVNPLEVEFIPGPLAPPAEWRDIKIHLNFAYVITEGGGPGSGMQIIDLSTLPDSASLVNTYNTTFTTAHNLFIDNGYAYVIGTSGGGGMHILDLSNPVNPVETAYYISSGYIHDVYVWNDTVVACAVNTYDLVDVSDKLNPQWISSSAAIPGIYAHSGWMTEDKRYFYGTEEFNAVDITVWDLQDRTSWDLSVPSWQTNSGATVHNLFILGNYAHVSYYTDGYVVLDISNPKTPFLVGQYDTPSMLGCYPYLPSGLTICSDIVNGLYVFQFTADDVPPSINHTPVTEVLNSDPVTITAQIFDNGAVKGANLRYRKLLESPSGDWIMVTDPDGPSGNTFEFEIPGFANQTVIEYYISAQDNNNNVSTSPAGGSGVNPAGNIPPTVYYSYKIMIPGPPIITSVHPLNDTTITLDDRVIFHVDAVDTSGFNLTYSWFTNSLQVGNQSATYYYNADTNPNVPRVDTVLVKVSNGFINTDYSWLVTVEVPSGVTDGNDLLSYSLKQNYPNPFNPTTQINFSIPNSEFVNLTVYNSLGENVSELVNEYKPAGEYLVKFDASLLTSGIYIVKLTAGSFNQIIKLSLVK